LSIEVLSFTGDAVIVQVKVWLVAFSCNRLTGRFTFRRTDDNADMDATPLNALPAAGLYYLILPRTAKPVRPGGRRNPQLLPFELPGQSP
jgi:hypothetical protein